MRGRRDSTSFVCCAGVNLYVYEYTVFFNVLYIFEVSRHMPAFLWISKKCETHFTNLAKKSDDRQRKTKIVSSLNNEQRILWIFHTFSRKSLTFIEAREANELKLINLPEFERVEIEMKQDETTLQLTCFEVRPQRKDAMSFLISWLLISIL